MITRQTLPVPPLWPQREASQRQGAWDALITGKAHDMAALLCLQIAASHWACEHHPSGGHRSRLRMPRDCLAADTC